jgi:hypothetical protein
MNEVVIPFISEMYKAILDGRKTQTRRIVRTPLVFDWGCGIETIHDAYHVEKCDDGKSWGFLCGGDMGFEYIEFPYGKVGDVIRASNDDNSADKKIQIEIVDIRVQRMQEISQKDAKQEGLPHAHPHRHGLKGIEKDGETPDLYAENHNTGVEDCWVCAFKELIVEIYGAETWNKDPWVWVLEFKKKENQ